MRIDAANAEVVATRQLVDTPEILKILFRGSKADLGVLKRIRAEGHPTLYDYWKENFGLGENGRLRGSGNGYQKLRTTSSLGRDGLRGVDASYLRGRPQITTGPFHQHFGGQFRYSTSLNINESTVGDLSTCLPDRKPFSTSPHPS